MFCENVRGLFDVLSFGTCITNFGLKSHLGSPSQIDLWSKLHQVTTLSANCRWIPRVSQLYFLAMGVWIECVVFDVGMLCEVFVPKHFT